jgi:O-antigen/teichoic acid export membrane protein
MTRNFLSLAGAQVAGALLGFAVTVYLARTLSLGNFGVFAFAQSVAAYLTLFSDLGLHLVGVNRVALRPHRIRYHVSTLISLRLVLGIMVYCLFGVAVALSGRPGAWKLAMLVFGASLFAHALSPDWAFRGMQRMAAIGVSLLVYGGILLGAVLLLVRGPDDLTAAAVAWTGAAFAASAALWFAFARRFGPVRLRFRVRRWKGLLAAALPLGITFLLVQAYLHLPIFGLGLLRPGDTAEAEMAWYNASFRIVLFFFFVASAYGFALHPALTKMLGQGAEGAESFRRQVRRSLGFCLGFGLPVAFGGFLVAEDLLPFLFGQAFAPSSGVFRILIWQIPILFAGLPFSQILLARGRGRRLLAAVGAGLGLYLLLAFILIPAKGPQGAAAAVVAAEILLQGLVVLFAFGDFPRARIGRLLLSCAAATAAMVAVLHHVHGHVLLRVALGAVVYLAVLLLVRGVFQRRPVEP